MNLKQLHWFCIFLLLGLSACGPQSQLGERAARERLRKDFISVHEHGDREGFLGLYFLEGVLERDVALIRLAIENEIHLPIAQISFEDLGAEDQIDFQYQGQQYSPTLPPKLKMVVRYASEDHLTISYLIGFREGAYYLITARPFGPVKSSEED